MVVLVVVAVAVVVMWCSVARKVTDTGPKVTVGLAEGSSTALCHIIKLWSAMRTAESLFFVRLRLRG